jgi:molybdopterin-guanine dinucleotide biosynthesis protein A
MHFVLIAEIKSMTDAAVFGLVLNGGKSQRMGRDKGLIEFHGKPQREHLFLMLREICQDVFVSCKSGMAIPDFLNPMPDRYSIESPLNGILTAFDFNPSVAWLCVAVDMPNISREGLSYLIQKRDPNAFATCYYDSDGVYPEPLLTLWEPIAAPALKEFFVQGQISPRKFLMENRVNILKAVDPELLKNINSNDDLERYQRDRS